MTKEELEKLDVVMALYWGKLQLYKRLDETLHRPKSKGQEKAMIKWNVARLIRDYLAGESDYDLAREIDR